MPLKQQGAKVRRAIIAVALSLAVIAVAPPVQAQAQSDKTAEPDAQTFRQRLDDQKKQRVEIPISPAILDNYVGYYQLNAFRVFTVTRADKILVIKLSGEDGILLYPEGPKKFFYKAFKAQISFVTDPQGRATGLILHQGGFERPASRVDAAQAKKLEDAYAQRIDSGAPLPGSEAALRHQIEAIARGQQDFAAMSGDLAAQKRAEAALIERQFQLAGPLQSLSFRGVGSHGSDIYEAKFANGIFICRILLPAPDAKISDLLYEFGP